MISSRIGLGKTTNGRKGIVVKTMFTRKEADRLLRLLEWVNVSTLGDDNDKNEIKEIAMKLKVALKEYPEDDNFEFLVEQ